MAQGPCTLHLLDPRLHSQITPLPLLRPPPPHSPHYSVPRPLPALAPSQLTTHDPRERTAPKRNKQSPLRCIFFPPLSVSFASRDHGVLIPPSRRSIDPVAHKRLTIVNATASIHPWFSIRRSPPVTIITDKTIDHLARFPGVTSAQFLPCLHRLHCNGHALCKQTSTVLMSPPSHPPRCSPSIQVVRLFGTHSWPQSH
jgi:hypothetical protein